MNYTVPVVTWAQRLARHASSDTVFCSGSVLPPLGQVLDGYGAKYSIAAELFVNCCAWSGSPFLPFLLEGLRGVRTLKGSGVAESRTPAGPRFVKNPIQKSIPNDTFLIRQGGPPSGYPSKGINTTPFKVVGGPLYTILYIVITVYTVYCIL